METLEYTAIKAPYPKKDNRDDLNAGNYGTTRFVNTNSVPAYVSGGFVLVVALFSAPVILLSIRIWKSGVTDRFFGCP